MKRDGRHALIEQFISDEIRFMFGNPGTVEQGFLDVMNEYQDKLKYIFALQESIAVAAADGYARVTQRLGLIQLHSGVGLGNGIGNLYQAFRGHSPLLVIAGEAGMQYQAMDAQMAADLVAIARPVTKYATRVTHPSSVLRTIRRAIKMALTPPSGPVFVALPMDVLDAQNDEEIIPSCQLVTATAPTNSHIQDITEILKSALSPIIIMGDGVSFSRGSAELESVANLIGAEVWGANSSEINISAASPLYCGQLGHMFGFESKRHTRNADVVLICGTYVFPEVFPELIESEIFALSAKIIHIDLDSYEIAKNFRVTVGVVSDPKETLARVATALESSMSNLEKSAATNRRNKISERTKKTMADQMVVDARAAVPSVLTKFAAQLAKSLPSDSMIFDESLTHSAEITRYLVCTEPGSYFQSRGGSLGLGIPGAIGMKLAHPDQTVFCFTGDGASLYTIQALWTAAHHKVGAKFVICNNRSYRLLKLNLQEYWRDRNEAEHAFPACFDIREPDVGFAELASALGVPGERVESVDQIEGSIDRALSTEGPYLIDLIITD